MNAFHMAGCVGDCVLRVSLLSFFLSSRPHDAKGRRATTYHDDALHPDCATGSQFPAWLLCHLSCSLPRWWPEQAGLADILDGEHSNELSVLSNGKRPKATLLQEAKTVLEKVSLG